MSDDAIAAFAQQLAQFQASMEARMDRTDARFDRLEGRFDSLEVRFEALARQFDSQALHADTQITALRAELVRTRADVMERIDRLQDTVAQLVDESFVNYHRADKAEVVARGAMEDNRLLTEIVAGMQRQIHRLQTNVQRLLEEADSRNGKSTPKP